MIKIHRTIPFIAVLIAIVVAGCGSSSDGSSTSSAGPSSLASPGSVVYVEGDLKPTGGLKTNVDSLASTIAGINNLGEFVVSELESSAGSEGGSFDYATEVEPWLGKRAGVAFARLEDGELSDPLIAVGTTDVKATQAFVDKQSRQSKDPYKGATYEGIEFEVGGSEGNAIGLIDEWLVIAADEKAFKAAVDASEGDSLAGEDRFQNAIDAASNGSLADIYVDVGAVIKQSDDEIDPQAKEVLQSAGIDPSEATAVASVIPGSDQVEIDLSSDLGGEEAPSGDVSKLLGSLPAGSTAAFAASGFGTQLEEAIDSLDESGLPPTVPPNELKNTLSEAGIDLDKIASSLEDAAVFAEGSSKNDIAGALVVTSSDSEAAEAIANLGTLLRGARIPGVTAVSGKAAGFSIRSDELGRNPVVVVAKGNRIAIGYGLAQALKGLAAGSGATLSGTPTYKEAVAALGSTPISAFVDGPAALSLAESLVPRSKEGFWEAVPYLKKVTYIGLGSGTDDSLATAKLIAGVSK